jgi:hypothetical protein
MKILLALASLVLAICASAFGQAFTLRDVAAPWNQVAPAPAVPITYIISDDFEETKSGDFAWGSDHDGYDATTAAAAGAGSNPDYATALVGSQSLALTNTAQYARWVMATTNSNIYVYFQVRTDLTNGASQYMFTTSVPEPGNAVQFYIYHMATGVLKVYSGTGSDSTAGIMAMGVTNHVWGSCLANGVATVAFSTDGIRPTAGNNFKQIANGTGTNGVTRFLLAGASGEYIFDHFRVATTQIGDNP